MTTPQTEDEQEFTELVDYKGGRIDLVGKGANGIGRFLIAKQQDGQAGLLDPGFVRDLVSKAQPVTGSQEGTVTMTGTPGAIAKLIHEAAQAVVVKVDDAVAKATAAYPDDPAEVAVSKAAYDLVVKAKYNADDKRKMAANGVAMKDESYPIKDEEDLDNAIHAVGRGGSSHDAIRKHIISRAKSLGKSSLIPDNWGADGSLKEKVSKDMADLLTDVDLDPALDESRNADDLEVPLAAPGDDVPGDPGEPGSPAWEAIDAATACKWTAILSRARVAIDMLADREMLEGQVADPDDIDNAYDLEDVCCAIDFAISVLAPYAVAEQSEVDTGSAELVSKAMAGFDPQPLDVIEGLAAVRKAGRVLSAANEAEIRSAADSLNKVLAALPQAPIAGESVTKEEGAMEPVSKETPDEAAANATPVDAGGTTGLGEPRATGPSASLPGDGPQGSLPGDRADRQVIKADGDKPAMQAVFDADGNLVGIVDPTQITPVAGASKTSDGSVAATPEGAGDGSTDAGGDADDMTPQPAAATGTPSDAPADDDQPVAKSDGDEETITVTKAGLSSLVAAEVTAFLTERDEAVAKAAELSGENEVLKAEVARLGEQPAAPKVFTNGAVPPPNMLRGQDRPAGGTPVDVAKAAELKGVLYTGTAPEQNAAATQMQEMAIAALSDIHNRR